MNAVEYGKDNSQVIILLHGGGLSWWNYRDVAEQLQQNYHVVIPILDGHAGSDHAFTSIEENAQEIIAYIDQAYHGSVSLIGGVSLGAQIAVEILSQRPDICKAAILESALVLPMKMTERLVKPMIAMSYGLIKQSWFAKLQFRSLRIPDKFYEEYYRDTCKITKADMSAFLCANASYELKKSLCHTQARVHIFVSQKEPSVMIRSAQRMHAMLPGSTLEIKKRLYHGEYSLKHAHEYADTIHRIITDLS